MEEGGIDHGNMVSGCMKDTKEKYSKTLVLYPHVCQEGKKWAFLKA